MPKTVSPEAKLKREICEFLENEPTLKFWINESVGVRGRKKNSRFQKNGVPDILGYWGGRFFAVEVKAPGVKARNEEQLAFVRDVNLSGGFGAIVDSIDLLVRAMVPYAQSHGLSYLRLLALHEGYKQN